MKRLTLALICLLWAIPLEAQREVHANEATAAQRRVFFHLVDQTDGITPETGEAGGQPQISTDGGAFTNTGIGTLTHMGNGRYYADLTQAAVATAGGWIETRYDSANTAEAAGTSVNIVAFDGYDIVRMGLTALPNAAADAAGGLVISDAGGLDADAMAADATALNDTKIPDTLSLVNVNTEIDTALSDIHLDHLLGVDYDPASKPGVATALLNELIESNAGVSRYTIAALAQAPGGGGDGSGLTAIPWNAAWDTEVESEVDDAITASTLFTIRQNQAGTNILPVKIVTAQGLPATNLSDVVCQYSLDGGAFANIGDASETEPGNGWYTFDLTAGETNGVLLLIRCTSATHPGGAPWELTISPQT